MPKIVQARPPTMANYAVTVAEFSEHGSHRGVRQDCSRIGQKEVVIAWPRDDSIALLDINGQCFNCRAMQWHPPGLLELRLPDGDEARLQIDIGTREM